MHTYKHSKSLPLLRKSTYRSTKKVDFNQMLNLIIPYSKDFNIHMLKLRRVKDISEENSEEDFE